MAFSPEQFDGEMFLRQEYAANQALIATQCTVEFEAGDVLFFHCRLLHAAGDNRSSEAKFSLVSTYHASDNRPLAGSRSAALPDIPL
jgi:phytanoyl-CoA hydroxylase